MTSGNLLNLDIFNKIGPFREDFFIDYVDNEYCLKLNTYGYRIIQIKDAFLHHNLGYQNKHSYFGLKNTTTINYDPIRRYYSTKNRLKTRKLYYRYYPLFCLKDIYLLLIQFFKII